ATTLDGLTVMVDCVGSTRLVVRTRLPPPPPPQEPHAIASVVATTRPETHCNARVARSRIIRTSPDACALPTRMTDSHANTHLAGAVFEIEIVPRPARGKGRSTT